MDNATAATSTTIKIPQRILMAPFIWQLQRAEPTVSSRARGTPAARGANTGESDAEGSISAEESDSVADSFITGVVRYVKDEVWCREGESEDDLFDSDPLLESQISKEINR